jgi:hypothetical protein
MRSPTTTRPVAIPIRLQRRTGIRSELRNSLDKIEPGLNGTLGVVLVRLRITEIGENAIAHVLGDEAAVALDQFGAAAVIGGNDAPQVLWVEFSRQRRRADQVAKHDRQLTTLGLVLCVRRSCRRGLGRSRSRTAKLPDRPQHPPAMTERDAESL